MVCNDSQTCHLGNLLPIFDLLVPEREGRKAGTLLQPRFIPFYWQKKKKKKLANGDPIYGWFLGSFMRRRTLKITKTNYKSKIALKNNTSTILLLNNSNQMFCFQIKSKAKHNFNVRFQSELVEKVKMGLSKFDFF